MQTSTNMTANSESWETEIIRYLNFLEDADNNEDLVAILRGHLYIEIALTELLSANPQTIHKFDEKTDYQDKVGLTKRPSLLNKQERKMLKAIGLLRNRFAHLHTGSFGLHVKTAIDSDDLAELEETLPGSIAKAAIDKTGEKFYQDRDPNLPSTTVRILLRVIFNWLSSRAAHEQERYQQT
jgi:hypothetical protein